MTAPLTGHPFGDMTAILNNGWSGPNPLPYIFQSDVFKFTFDYDLSGLGSGSQSMFRAIVEEALDQISSFTSLSFTEAADGGFPQTHIAFEYDASQGSSGFATHQYTSNDGDGDVEVIRSDVMIGGITPYIILHEIGHALTLLHTGPNQNPDHLPFVDPQYRNNNYTVMHYDDSGVGPSVGEWDYAFYQILDIYALQLRFGENTTTFAGNSVHTASTLWDADTLGYLQALWDAGGTDRLDFSAETRDQYIDLNEGAFSDVGPIPGAELGVTLDGTPEARDYTQPEYNLSIAYGTEIEEAAGGAGDDIIIGNALANVLIGGDGDDVLYGDGWDGF